MYPCVCVNALDAFKREFYIIIMSYVCVVRALPRAYNIYLLNSYSLPTPIILINLSVGLCVLTEFSIELESCDVTDL